MQATPTVHWAMGANTWGEHYSPFSNSCMSKNTECRQNCTTKLDDLNFSSISSSPPPVLAHLQISKQSHHRVDLSINQLA